MLTANEARDLKLMSSEELKQLIRLSQQEVPNAYRIYLHAKAMQKDAIEQGKNFYRALWIAYASAYDVLFSLKHSSCYYLNAAIKTIDKWLDWLKARREEIFDKTSLSL